MVVSRVMEWLREVWNNAPRIVIVDGFHLPQPQPVNGGHLSDSVSVDAKRILLRYGAPIAVLDKVSEVHRVEFAREIARTTLADREPRLREMLTENGYIHEED